MPSSSCRPGPSPSTRPLYAELTPPARGRAPPTSTPPVRAGPSPAPSSAGLLELARARRRPRLPPSSTRSSPRRHRSDARGVASGPRVGSTVDPGERWPPPPSDAPPAAPATAFDVDMRPGVAAAEPGEVGSYYVVRPRSLTNGSQARARLAVRFEVESAAKSCASRSVTRPPGAPPWSTALALPLRTA